MSAHIVSYNIPEEIMLGNSDLTKRNMINITKSHTLAQVAISVIRLLVNFLTNVGGNFALASGCLGIKIPNSDVVI